MQVDSNLTIPHQDLLFHEKVGEGSYGEVWRGTWQGSGGGETVAIKKIKTLGVSEKILQKLYLEVLILSKLRHPNIVTIYGVAFAENEMWIILEFLSDGNLHALLSSDKQISWDTRIRLALSAAKAVNFLHSRGDNKVLHQDLKSLNFLLGKTGTDLKLTDFGMATAKIAVSSSSTAPKSSIGSYRWAAPETFAKNPVWTEKGDIYSLGMTFYELAARNIPFIEIAESHQVIYLVKCENERPDIPPDCPKEFADIMQKCWDQDPNNRPSSNELVQLLSELVAKLDVPAQTPKQRTKRLFFELDKEELLRLVPADCVQTLTDPPHFPGSTDSLPPLPSSVKIVSLKKEKANPLMSKTYDAQIFERVELYFRRFFAPHDSSAQVILEQVDVIINEEVEKRFKNAEADLHASLDGLAELKDEDQSNLQRHYLNRLLTSDNLVTRHSNPTSAWHGASTSKLSSISWYGMLNLSGTDPGYYGKGMYFTQHPKYGEYYAEKVKQKTEGKFNLVLCWALLGRPYAVTKVDMGCACKPTYTSHYTLVTKKQADQDFCSSLSDYQRLEGMNSYFPVKAGEEVQGDEIVIFEPSHVLPRFIVHYSVTKNLEKVFHDPLYPEIHPTTVPEKEERAEKEKAADKNITNEQPDHKIGAEETNEREIKQKEQTTPTGRIISPPTSSPFLPETASPLAPSPSDTASPPHSETSSPPAPSLSPPPSRPVILPPLTYESDKCKAEKKRKKYEGRANEVKKDGRPRIIAASRDEIKTRVLCELGADVNVLDSDGRSALSRAVLCSDARVAHILVKFGADVHQKDNKGKNALHYAADGSFYRNVEYLIAHGGADVNCPDGNKLTALTLCRAHINTYFGSGYHSKFQQEQTEYIILTLGGAATSGSTGNTPLHTSAYKGVLPPDWNGENIDATNINGVTPIFLAALKGKEETVMALLQHGASVNAHKGTNGESTLHAAVRGGSSKIISKVVEHGADVNDNANKFGYSPLFLAAMFENNAAIEVLLKSGANINMKNATGRTPIAVAAVFKNDSSVELLAKKGANPDIVDDDGNTALLAMMCNQEAAKYSEERIVAILSSAGASMNAKNKKGDTPLSLAKKEQSAPDISWALRRHGAVDCVVM